MSTPRILRLIWDDWNREHIARHGVSPAEADEVAGGDPLVIESYKNRLVLVDEIESGRILAVVVTAVYGQPSSFYVFTARPASRKERVALARRSGGSP